MIECFEQLLSHMGNDKDRPELAATPLLAAKAFEQLSQGYNVNPQSLIAQELMRTPKGYNGSIELPDIPFISLCEHTFLPFLGTVTVHFSPNQSIIGAGCIEKLIHAFARRMQLQERLTLQIAETIYNELAPHWVQVDINAIHSCMDGRQLNTKVRLGIG
ncbi:MAG: GTP cyclohydrolase I [Myxococcota bacterium]